MKTKIYFLAILITLFIVQSCKKELTGSGFSKSLLWEQSGCNEMFNAPVAPIILPQNIEKGNQFKYPSFNPNNESEIIYFEQEANSAEETPTQSGKLVKYNYETGGKTTLLNNFEIAGKLTWNKNGWIAFETTTHKIYIVRDNGSDLTQFYSGNSQSLTWLNGGDTLLWKHLNVGTGENYLFQKEIGQQEVDTLFHGNFDVFSVSNANTLLSASGLQLQTMDLNQTPLSLQNYPSTLGGSIFDGLDWHPNADKFYISKIGSLETAGLFEVDFATGAGTRIVEFCDRELINFISCSPSGNILAFQKLERHQKLNSSGLFYGTIIENSRIWLLNLNTLQETKLPL